MIENAFMDSVHRWTFQPKIEGMRVDDRTRSVMVKHRASLRRAQRFIVDDDAVRLACELSHQTMRMEPWTFLARLPYAPLWLEFDLHEKVKEFDRLGKLNRPNPKAPLLEGVSKVCGLLFDHDKGSETRWNCHMFMEDPRDQGVTIDPLAFVFDPASDGKVPFRGSATWNSPTLSLRPGMRRQDVVVHHTDIHGNQLPATVEQIDPEFNVIGLFERQGEHVGSPDYFVSKTAVIVEPWWEAWFGSNGKTKARLNDLAVMEARELAGMLRWIITLLASINGLPRDVAPRITRSGTKIMGANILPYLSHSNLSIKIPREDRIRYSLVRLDRAGKNMRRRWHRVIGHWRVIDAGRNPAGTWCRHMPAIIDNEDPNLAICEKCEMLIRWIPQHTRGDPTIGMVDHPAYHVHT